MDTKENSLGQSEADLVSYEGAPIAQVELDGTEYRVDVGRGSAVAISEREAGSVKWSFATEGKFDGLRLKAKALPYPVVNALATALKAAMSEQQEQAWG
jgi:hypothetical protein